MALNDSENTANPVDPDISLKPGSAQELIEASVHPQKDLEDEDSAVTKAEKVERHANFDHFEEPSPKRVKLESIDDIVDFHTGPTKSERQKGVAPIKPESVFLRHRTVSFWLTMCQILSASAWQQKGQQYCWCQ